MGGAAPTQNQQTAAPRTRGLQAPVPSPASTRPVFRVGTDRQLRAMCDVILDPARSSPIVGLTCRPGSTNPALAIEDVCEVVWENVTIYVIEPKQARDMNELLPAGLGAYNGAVRIWMPGVGEHPDVSWHPLIHDSTGIYGSEALQRLSAEFAISPADAGPLTPDQQAQVHIRSPATPTVAPEAPLLRVSARKDLRRLLADLRHAHDRAIVILTVGARGEGPAFPPRPSVRGTEGLRRDLCRGERRLTAAGWRTTSGRSSPSMAGMLASSGLARGQIATPPSIRLFRHTTPVTNAPRLRGS